MKKLLLCGALLGLVACGDNSSDSSSQLSLRLTDAPVVGVESLVINLDYIELKPAGGKSFIVEVSGLDEDMQTTDTAAIDLLALQGSASTVLLDNIQVPSGKYEWLRLHLDADIPAQLTTTGGGLFNLSIPSGENTGLKLHSPFILPANGSADFVLDFDVAKSLAEDNKGYKLRPTIRIIDQVQAGHVTGTVDGNLLTDCGETQASVYVFDGSDAALKDINLDAGTGPVASALVQYDAESTAYRFEVGYLLVGDYTLHLLCSVDNPESTEILSSLASKNVNVVAKQNTIANLVELPR